MTSARAGEPPDVVVVGGGPAGAAAAAHLAAAGHRVTILERRRHPRPKTCGDALSPLALDELSRLGLGDSQLAGFHRVDGLRLVGHGRSVDLPWPTHPTLPGHGRTARRDRFDELLVRHAEACGATLVEGCEAVAPIVERGFLRGASVRWSDGLAGEVRGRYLVVADGANSRFGRALGTWRERTWPYATAIRNYWMSPRAGDGALEAVVDVVDRDGHPVTGYGWVFPLGDGTVNAGVGVVSTTREFRSINTTQLLTAFATSLADRWELDPTAPLGAPASGRIPVGASVGPAAGPTHLVVGDAAGAANPLTGAGIEYALATGRMAAEVLADALGGGSAAALQRYPSLIRTEWGRYFQVARLLDRLGGVPWVVRAASVAAVRSPRFGAAVVRIATNELRSDRTGGAEVAMRVLRAASRVAPDA